MLYDLIKSNRYHGMHNTCGKPNIYVDGEHWKAEIFNVRFFDQVSPNSSLTIWMWIGVLFDVDY